MWMCRATSNSPSNNVLSVFLLIKDQIKKHFNCRSLSHYAGSSNQQLLIPPVHFCFLLLCARFCSPTFNIKLLWLCSVKFSLIFYLKFKPVNIWAIDISIWDKKLKTIKMQKTLLLQSSSACDAYLTNILTSCIQSSKTKNPQQI